MVCFFTKTSWHVFISRASAWTGIPLFRTTTNTRNADQLRAAFWVRSSTCVRHTASWWSVARVTSAGWLTCLSTMESWWRRYGRRWLLFSLWEIRSSWSIRQHTRYNSCECRSQCPDVISPNSTWLVTTRLDTFDVSSPCIWLSSLSNSMARHAGLDAPTRRTCQVVSRRDVMSQVEFGLYSNFHTTLSL